MFLAAKYEDKLTLLTPAISRTYLAEDGQLSEHLTAVVAQRRHSVGRVEDYSLPLSEHVFASRMFLCWPQGHGSPLSTHECVLGDGFTLRCGTMGPWDRSDLSHRLASLSCVTC